MAEFTPFIPLVTEKKTALKEQFAQEFRPCRLLESFIKLLKIPILCQIHFNVFSKNRRTIIFVSRLSITSPEIRKVRPFACTHSLFFAKTRSSGNQPKLFFISICKDFRNLNEKQELIININNK